MSIEMLHALTQLEKEKGLEKEVIIEAIEAALLSAYKKNYGAADNVRIDIDRESGDANIYVTKTVVLEVEDKNQQILLSEAQEYDPTIEEEDLVEVRIKPRNFGRISAQTAKQVVMQRLREAERNLVFEEFNKKENDIISAVVQRRDRRNVIVDLGKTEGIMLPTEQVFTESYRQGDRIKVYVLEVKRTSKGPSIIVSRTHPNLVKRLFELEVPEIHEGIVEIKGISREAGSRTKIAVYSSDENVDASGACIGQRGARVQAIVDALNGEKIDIINWSPNSEEFISSSLSPAKVVRVELNDETHSAEVTVPDFHLSLAIGKEGQNARLAAKLTTWKIDIRSESQLREKLEQNLLNMGEHDDDNEEETKKGQGSSLFFNEEEIAENKLSEEKVEEEKEKEIVENEDKVEEIIEAEDKAEEIIED